MTRELTDLTLTKNNDQLKYISMYMFVNILTIYFSIYHDYSLSGFKFKGA